MHFSSRARVNLRRQATLLACIAVLAGCGGDSVEVQPQGSSPPSSPPAGPQLGIPAPTGSIDVRAVDPFGLVLAGAKVTVFNAEQSAILATVLTGGDGRVLVGPFPGPLKISVLHSIGASMVSGVQVDPSQIRRLDIVVQPSLPVTVALLSATVPLPGISVNRREIDLEVRLAASARAPFQPNSYATGTDKSPLLTLSQCSVRVNGAVAAPRCPSEFNGVDRPEYVYQASALPYPDRSLSPYAAMLFLERSPRAAGLETGLRHWLAARDFMGGFRMGTASRLPDRTSVAGFMGSDPLGGTLMLPAPL
jgi:hypothetical protein